MSTRLIFLAREEQYDKLIKTAGTTGRSLMRQTPLRCLCRDDSSKIEASLSADAKKIEGVSEVKDGGADTNACLSGTLFETGA